MKAIRFNEYQNCDDCILLNTFCFEIMKNRVFFSLLYAKQVFSLFLSWQLGYEQRRIMYKEQLLTKRAELKMASTFKINNSMKAGKK